MTQTPDEREQQTAPEDGQRPPMTEAERKARRDELVREFVDSRSQLLDRLRDV